LLNSNLNLARIVIVGKIIEQVSALKCLGCEILNDDINMDLDGNLASYSKLNDVLR
jgi:hypothetical protein